jgi:hypothetical protein
MPIAATDNLVQEEPPHGVVLSHVAALRTSATCSVARHRDRLYLFACHLEWRDRRNIGAYQELVAALDDCDEEVRSLAEALLHRSSPRRHRKANERNDTEAPRDVPSN